MHVLLNGARGHKNSTFLNEGLAPNVKKEILKSAKTDDFFHALFFRHFFTVKTLF